MKYTIDIDGLRKWLLSKKYADFKPNAPTATAVLSAETIDEVEYFKMDKSEITLDRVVFYGQPFLVDCLGNDLSIVQLTKRKYKNPNGRLISGKFVETVISDCRTVFGSPLNGYWVIPDEFIQYHK